jgi:prolyl-tRNA editing enzyme YbaK/EbsC (Cys-tRNA(Pro) deacylase)
MLSSKDLQAFISNQGITAELVRPPGATPTVTTAAEAMGVSPDAIIKSVLFIISKRHPLLVIANGERRIQQKAIARHLGVGKKQVKLASPAEVLRWCDYPIGGVPPFGHPTPLRTLVDPHVLDQPMVYGGGGTEQVLMRIRTADLQAVIDAEVVDLCE